MPDPALIRLASGELDYRAIDALIREYVAWLRGRYQQDAWFVSEVLDRQALESELMSLATMYGAPNGRAFVAVDGDVVQGCGAWRRLDDHSCEMKRVFVPARFQGAGLGRRLCAALIESAREAGYATMKLDTVDRLAEAIALYRSIGFNDCAAYHDYPPGLMPYFRFMALPLQGDGSRVGGNVGGSVGGSVGDGGA